VQLKKKSGIASSLLQRFVIYGKFSDIFKVQILKTFVGGKEGTDRSIAVYKRLL
jgi:hypothetical protein